MQDPWQAELSKQVRLVRLQLSVPFACAGFLFWCQYLHTSSGLPPTNLLTSCNPPAAR